MQTLASILQNAARMHGKRAILAYPANRSASDSTVSLTYEELNALATFNSQHLRDLKDCKQGQVLLLYLEDHLETIIWFWSIVYAGNIPAMSTSLPRTEAQSVKHLRHLSRLLEEPICLTTDRLMQQFPAEPIVRLVDTESIQGTPDTIKAQTESQQEMRCTTLGAVSDIALLMLTSGSTGPCKAVSLTNQQIHASLAGKCAAFPLKTQDAAFLNWIRLDHVGSLVEIHLHALAAGVDQVHIQPEVIIARPVLFLELLERHKVARTFAPNFFLLELLRFFECAQVASRNFNLKDLHYLVSGGEANAVDTCGRLSQHLARHGAPSNVIVPGFGMAETCAGCSYNFDFPRCDLDRGNKFASLGTPVPGIEMRIVSLADESELSTPGTIGHLEVRGPIVFGGYYNEPSTTWQTFRSDGWFRTGDTAFLDPGGHLNLCGRTKELITINGVKYSLHELESALEGTNIPGVEPSFVVCLPYRSPSDDTEQIWVLYKHSYRSEDSEARCRAKEAITRRIMVLTSTCPHVLPLPTIGRTSLGKISRSQLKSQLESGGFTKEHIRNAELIRNYRSKICTSPHTPTQRLIAQALAPILNKPLEDIGVDDNIFGLGMTSLSLIQMQSRLREQLALSVPPVLPTIMSHPTIRQLEDVLQRQYHEYRPVVTLQPHGKRTPLWLVHPAAGEALVFVNLAKRFHDRSVYALRARGFYPEEPYFTSLEECISTYQFAMKARQPEGPYAILGYSYGAMVAFELAKSLEKEGSKVDFVASLNRPPYVSPRLQRLQWSDCLVNISFFLGLLPRDAFHKMVHGLREIPRGKALELVLDRVDPDRMEELGLNSARFERWIDVAYGLQRIGRNYKPHGNVAHVDVFHCNPVEFLQTGKEEWLRRLSAWDQFSREKALYFEVPGEHHEVLAPGNVQQFHKQLQESLHIRGV
ncbi:non-ribosomal peptide synthetase [Aspergillus homomorphus CBS 101889]|uniref:Thioesterase domain protein n=1 Tax=Aspergillus homomorphus (strain CBS 101889) TaxID=1450537 RepID=A0A395HXH6_ASPHC|nr:thioesterase domain protein [Aspergillus homomorphus CBS 101889]RAL10944.1 thioesterase domain protein [Aspergillus homomorphus CBS 101889]